MAEAQEYGARYQAIKQGGPFEVVKVSKPVPERDEVVIKTKAAGLNPIDYKMLLYGILVNNWPKTLGQEGAGLVEAVGSSVNNFKPGDEVLAAMFQGDRVAPFQEYAAVPAIQVARKPAYLSFGEAASLPVGFLTAAAAISLGSGISASFVEGVDKNGAKPKSILVLGGSSVVGSSTIQMLRLISSDFLILATSSPKHHDRVLSLGVDKAFDYKSADVVERIRAATSDGVGVEAIIDCVNGVAENNSLLDLLTGPKKFAEVATGANLEKEKIPAGVDHNMVSGPLVFEAPGGKNLFTALGRLLEEKKYKLPVEVKVVGHGLESIGEGLDELQKGVSGVKLVVTY